MKDRPVCLRRNELDINDIDQIPGSDAYTGDTRQTTSTTPRPSISIRRSKAEGDGAVIEHLGQ